MNKSNVIIIGHSYTSRLGIIRSLAQIGCQVIVIVMTTSDSRRTPIDCCSKYVDMFFFCKRNDEDALIKLLLEKCLDKTQKSILIPDGDLEISIIDKYRGKLNEFYLFPYIQNSSYDMTYWMDKSVQKKLASKIGLNVANGVIIDINEGKYTIPSDLKYPCFCKPLATMNGGKGGMRKCESKMQLHEALEYIVNNRSKTIKVLVEEYKEIEKEYALLGFSDGNHVVIPGILQFLVESKKNKGIALMGKVMPIDGYEELLSKFRQFVIEIGFVGIFDIDFFSSEGLYFFCEMNLRFGGSGYAITKMGCNLPAMMVRYFSGEKIDEEMKLKVNVESRYVNERMCIDDWNCGYISYKEYRHFLSRADILFIPDKEDLNPLKEYNKFFKKSLCINIIKRILGKR